MRAKIENRQLWGLLWGPLEHLGVSRHISNQLATTIELVEPERVAGLSAFRSTSYLNRWKWSPEPKVSEHSTIPRDTPRDVAHNTRCTAANSLGLRPLDGEPASGRMSYVSGQARKRAERSHLAEKPSSCRCASHSTGKWVRKFSSVILTGCRPSKILSTISGARKAH